MNRSRGHVLVEAPERDAHARRVALELAGYETRWCPGPDDCDGTTCGLVSEHRCALADWADVVVNALGVQRSNNRRVLRALADTHPGVPVVVETGAHSAQMWGLLLAGDEVVEAPTSAQDLVTAVGVALAGHGRAPTPAPDAGPRRVRMGMLSGFCSAPELE